MARASSDPLAGRDGLTLLNDRPINAETPAHLLDDAITPTARHFIRNNGATPESRDAETWTLTIDGEVDTPLTLSIADLKSRYEVVTRAPVIECGGNGRADFDPPASGNQWTVGAVGCSNWTGVRLRDVLMAVGVKPSAVHTANFGADAHLSGDPAKRPISRGAPIEKAMRPDNLIAFAVNGEDLHPENGAPLRLVIPGWPGSVSHKWVTRIWVRDQVHDGEKMGGSSDRLPKRPVAPGEEVAREDFVIMERMPVKSVIAHPMDGAETGREIEVRGHAWSGDRRVTRVDISTDFGATWTQADLDAPVNSGAWRNWPARIALPVAGYYELWARATDNAGDMQPFAVDWNPRGYGNNMMHRMALRAA